MPAAYVDSNASIAWPTSTLVSVGDRVFGSAGEQVIFECTTGGTTGGSEPAWDTTPGNTTNDNGAVWTARNFDSWLNAAPVISNGGITGVAAGSEVWFASDHDESTNAAVSASFSNATFAAPIKLLSVSSADDSLTAGASITATGASGRNVSISGPKIFVFGLTCHAGDNVNMGSTDQVMELEDCNIEPSDAFSLGGQSGLGIMRGGTVDHFEVGGTGVHAGSRGGRSHLINVTFLNTGGGSTPPFDFAADGSNILAEDCDLTNAAATLMGTPTLGDGEATLTLRRCKLPTSFVLLGADPARPGQWGRIEGCTDGTISVPELGLTEYRDFYGTVKSDLARRRNGGANDGENANEHSWEMATNGNAVELYGYLKSSPITRWVDAGDAQTVTIQIAGAVDLDDDEFWIEVESPNEIDSPNTTARGNFQTTRVALLTGPTALTRSSETWEGTGTGTDGSTGQQKLSVTINPAEAGPVIVKCFLAKLNTTVYIDPKILVA